MKQLNSFALFLGLSSLLGAFADVYMHNPRGSNDRNCERNVNRNNGNRLFDRYNKKLILPSIKIKFILMNCVLLQSKQ
jgi:hypothetical protein